MTATALSVVHNVLRKKMFDLCIALCRAEPRDVSEIQKGLDDLFVLLEQHAHRENESFAPVLERTNPTALAMMVREHQEQEQQLNQLRASSHALTLESSSGHERLHELALDFSRFTGEMLLHLDREEREWKDALAPAQEEVEAIGIAAANQPAEAQRAFLSMIGEVTTSEQHGRIESAYQRAREKTA